MSVDNWLEPSYIFAPSPAEIEQLRSQSRLLEPATRRFLSDAGIMPGMSVLDVGSGAGDVALLLAELVGPSGRVVGIERDAQLLQSARARGITAGQAHLSFIQGDLSRLDLLDLLGLSERFDAIVGRYILQHVPNPAAVLRQLCQFLEPGGIVVFMEADLTRLGTSVPSAPLFEQVGDWVREAFRLGGADPQMGLRLFHVFLDAGLPAPEISCQDYFGGGADWPWIEMIAARVRSLLPLLLQHGITSAEEVDIDTLATRLRASLTDGRGVATAPDLIAAWATISTIGARCGA